MTENLSSISDEILELEQELYYAEEEVCSIENALQSLYNKRRELIVFRDEE